MSNKHNMQNTTIGFGIAHQSGGSNVFNYTGGTMLDLTNEEKVTLTNPSRISINGEEVNSINPGGKVEIIIKTTNMTQIVYSSVPINIEIKGDCDKVETNNGSVVCRNVTSVVTTNGSIDCKNIKGDCTTAYVSITCQGNISGNCSTISGTINVQPVKRRSVDHITETPQ